MHPDSKTANYALETRGIVKTFPGVRALDDVSFSLKKGEVHALVGENGAGKSTLMHILGGVHQPDAGEIFLEGEKTRLTEPHTASLKGISVVFQELSLSDELSIAENIFANRQPLAFSGLINWKALYSETEKMLKLFEWDIDPRTPVSNLPAAKQQVVEILKAISQQPKVLILDEPTSSLTTIETSLLFRNIRALKEKGVSFIYISHHLPEVFEIADRVTVLRDGKVVDTFKTSDVDEETLIQKMVGRELVDMYGSRCAKIGDALFKLENASRKGAFENINLQVRKGEILGLAGLAGAGRTELGRAIFGVEPLDSGNIILDGRILKIRSPQDAISHGIAYMSEDRKYDGLFLEMSIKNNCVAPSLAKFASGLGLMDDQAIADFAEENCARFNIVTPHINQKVANLSGGNQQKVLLAMWLGIHPRLLIADEPTRGVDVGAKSEIYCQMRELTNSGIGIIMISSDLLEILGLSDRVLVMRNGKIAGEFSRENATEENIIACASGVGAVVTA